MIPSNLTEPRPNEDGHDDGLGGPEDHTEEAMAADEEDRKVGKVKYRTGEAISEEFQRTQSEDLNGLLKEGTFCRTMAV